MSKQTTDSVRVLIFGETYHLRGTDPEHIERLAEYVEAKLHAVAQRTNTIDTHRIAVLAALNIADELVTARMRLDRVTGAQSTVHTRANTLAGLLDEVLAG